MIEFAYLDVFSPQIQRILGDNKTMNRAFLILCLGVYTTGASVAEEILLNKKRLKRFL